jgi:hypothetical protein
VVGYGVGSIVGGHLAFVGHIVGGRVSHFALVGGYVASGTGFTLGDCFTDGSSVGG